MVICSLPTSCDKLLIISYFNIQKVICSGVTHEFSCADSSDRRVVNNSSVDTCRKCLFTQLSPPESPPQHQSAMLPTRSARPPYCGSSAPYCRLQVLPGSSSEWKCGIQVLPGRNDTNLDAVV